MFRFHNLLTRSRLHGLAVTAGLLATIVSTLRVVPHQLAYFNELSGGPQNGFRHLLHSNLEYGQDLLELRRLDLDPETEIRINVFGLTDFYPPNARHIPLRDIRDVVQSGRYSTGHPPTDAASDQDGVLVLGARLLMCPELVSVRNEIIERAERVGYSVFAVHNFPPTNSHMRP
jgi:hypothetical protein